jgi:hypothetical protein
MVSGFQPTGRPPINTSGLGSFPLCSQRHNVGAEMPYRSRSPARPYAAGALRPGSSRGGGWLALRLTGRWVQPQFWLVHACSYSFNCLRSETSCHPWPIVSRRSTKSRVEFRLIFDRYSRCRRGSIANGEWQQRARSSTTVRFPAAQFPGAAVFLARLSLLHYRGNVSPWQ